MAPVGATLRSIAHSGLDEHDRLEFGMSSPIFTSWQPEHAALWGNVPLRLKHRLHQHELFSRPALARLIEAAPKSNYMLIETGRPNERKLWREGEIGQLDGAGVIEAIDNGRIWLNLLRVNEIDPRYGELLDEIFAELEGRVPGLKTFKRINGILISSPRAQVYYHFDTAGQTLWQIAGSKRVYLYPPAPPFLTPESLENVILYNNETGIRYEPWYDEYATPLELKAGDMAQWPLNMPHRIENGDELSVSMTIEYFTTDIRRRMFVNGANGILREKLKLNPARNVSGPAFWAKTAMYAAAAKGGLLTRERNKRRPITFQLDRDFLARPSPATSGQPEMEAVPQAGPAAHVVGDD